jgi:hypothetical protein
MQQWRQVSSIYWKAQGRVESTGYFICGEIQNQENLAWTKKENLQNTFGAWDIRSPCTFNRLSQGKREGFESGFHSEQKV